MPFNASLERSDKAGLGEHPWAFSVPPGAPLYFLIHLNEFVVDSLKKLNSLVNFR